MRVFVGPIEIAGFYSNLSQGLRSLGVECDYFNFTPHAYDYGGETTRPKILKLADFFNRYSRKSQRTLFSRLLLRISGAILEHIWAIHAIFKYDAFIFGYGKSLFWRNKDLILLRWLDKIVISNFHGSDARPPYIDGFIGSKDGIKPSMELLFRTAAKIKSVVEKHEKYASIIVGPPFISTQFSRLRQVNFFAVGLPLNLNKEKNSDDLHCNDYSKKMSQKTIRILHSPSHPAGKGTKLIEEAIYKLKARGYSIDFVLIHGEPFNVVLEEIKKCDFVVDQVYSCTPMAGFAAESAWFGKPCVVGGYGLDTLRQFVPEGMWPPSKICHPDNIEEAIEDLINNNEERENLGRQARLFVHDKWNAKEVAQRYIKLIQGDFPDEWWLDPRDVIYLEGGGQSIESTKLNIRELVEIYGSESLQLSHRPDLEKAFLDFANLNGNQ
jgi:glycosyltransferase involved in cell wall biosynthesis